MPVEAVWGQWQLEVLCWGGVAAFTHGVLYAVLGNGGQRKEHWVGSMPVDVFGVVKFSTAVWSVNCSGHMPLVQLKLSGVKLGTHGIQGTGPLLWALGAAPS